MKLQRATQMKLKHQKAEEETESFRIMKKKQRTKKCRQVRRQISPILYSAPPRNFDGSSAFNSNLSSLHEVSCNSSGVQIESNPKKRKSRENDDDDNNVNSSDARLRRITRSYSEKYYSVSIANEAEESELSCVESNSVADFESRSSKLIRSKTEIVGGIQVNEDTESVVNSEFSSVRTKFNSGGEGSISVASASESCLSRKMISKHSAMELDISEISRDDSIFSAVEQRSKSSEFDADLACEEHLSNENVDSDYSSSQEVLSELQSEILPESLDLESSDYTPSIFLSSGSEFSEKSDNDMPPSRTYSLLIEFRREFSRSNFCPDNKRSSIVVEADNEAHSSLERFEDKDDEESYQRLRERERSHLFLYNYVDLYRSTTAYGDLISEQRSVMIHWIVEHSNAKKFQQETIFLGVCLLDRFLSKGFFKNKRNLQIVGVACLTLAARIVENQPYNSVRQKYFHIGTGVYSRNEVVAMEWLVQEVLSFRCFLPTIYNFLWFYIKAAGAKAAVEKKARYLAVLALSDHMQLGNWPSAVAAALVILAASQSNQIDCYQQVIKIHCRAKEDDLHGCVKGLEWLLQFVN